MAKKVKQVIKIVIQAGKANPAPPLGSTLGPTGIQLMQFCKEFNEKTATMQGAVPAVITIFEDRTYEFILKTPPVSELIKQALKIKKGAGNPKKQKVGSITKAQLTEIAEKKMIDLNCHDVESAVKMIEGSCKSMGVKVA